MAIMMGESCHAWRALGPPEEDVSKASEEVASFENRLPEFENRMVELRGDMQLTKWMMGSCWQCWDCYCGCCRRSTYTKCRRV